MTETSATNDQNIENAAEAIEKLTSPSFWTKQHLLAIGSDFLKVMLIFLIGFLFIKIILHFVHTILAKGKVNRSGIYYIDVLLKFLLYMILIVIAANNVGINAGSIIAFIASFGLAVALALKGSLTDLASGIMLILTKPIEVGDRIFLEEDDDFYEVEQIKLFSTYLKNRKNIIVIVPNEKISQNKVKNLSRSPYVYADMEVSVAYGSDLELVKKLIRQSIRTKDIVSEGEIIVSVTKLNQSAVDFYVGVPVLPEKYTAVKGDLLENIYATFRERQIEIPYPQRVIHLTKEK